MRRILIYVTPWRASENGTPPANEKVNTKTSPVYRQMSGPRRWRLLYPYACAILAAVCNTSTGLLHGHPMGNFSISHYSKLTATPWTLELLYLVDVAEIPTFEEKRQLDQDGDGAITASEKQRYLKRKAEEFADGLRLMLNGTRMHLERVSEGVDLRPGGLNLPTLRLTMNLRLRWPAGSLKDSNIVSYQDNNFPGRVGWKEIIVIGSDLELLQSSVPSKDLSDELTQYPEDPQTPPPEVLSASFGFSLEGLRQAQQKFPERTPPNPSSHRDLWSLKTHWALWLVVALLPAAILVFKFLRNR